MPKSFQRIQTHYPGVYFIEGRSISTGKPEKIFYIRYRKGKKAVDEKVGRQFQDDMTAAKAARIRASRIDGKDMPNVEKRAVERATRKAAEDRWTISKIWDSYCENHPYNKVLAAEKQKFNKHLRNTLGTKEPSELLPLDVDRLRLSLQKKGHWTTAARILELLRRTINYGVEKNLSPPLLFKIKIPKLNNETTEDLTDRQLKSLLDVLDKEEDQQVATVMRLALFTGLRKSEILRLEWDDIDTDKGFINIRNPKSGRDQVVPLSDAAAAIIRDIEPADGNSFIFPGHRKNTCLTTLNRKSIARIKKAAGLPNGFRPIHGLRHVFASTLASSGQVDLFTLQKLLTHKSAAMTQRYAHLRDDVLRAASNVAGDLISDAMKQPANKKPIEIKK
jgi:integrase